MKKMIIAALLAIAGVLTAHTALAEEVPELSAVEYDRLIVNWSPNAQRLANVLAYRCQTCAPVRLQITRDTELQAGNEALPIEHLKQRVDWAGLVQTLSSQPDTIIKITLL